MLVSSRSTAFPLVPLRGAESGQHDGNEEMYLFAWLVVP